SGNADNRRCPGDVLEEIKQLAHQPSLGIARLQAPEMHEQPSHLQQGSDGKDNPQPPAELRNKRIAVEHHRASFGTTRRYPSPRCVSISMVALSAASCFLRWWTCTGMVLVSGSASAP